MRKTQSAITAHLPALMYLRRERVRFYADGRVEAQPWADEVIYFIRNQIQPALTERERRLLGLEHDRIEDVARTSSSFYRLADHAEA